MTNKIFALIDCNNFFVSCERLFRPDLQNKPVVVLSSNDGCVVARSNEAKRLGVPMGAPAFKYRDLFEKHKIVKFSGSFGLYGDISKRITGLLATITPRIEVYSVDESFLDLSQLPINNYVEWGRQVRDIILKHVGVPVSIGIAPSKTLAKLGADAAKTDKKLAGAFSFVGSPEQSQAVLKNTPIEDIWGIGWRLAPKLRAEGISNAYGLSQVNPRRAQQLMGIRGRQTVAELNGTSCFRLSLKGDPPKSILRSRTFGEDTSQAYVLESAIASMAAQATFRLRRDNLLARKIGVFTNTNRHKPGYRRWAREITPHQPTNDTGLVTNLLVQKLGEFFNDKQSYHRLGVYLYDLIPEDSLQTDILGQVSATTHDRTARRMQAVDQINKKYGRGKVYYATEDLSQSWRPKHHIRSPQYVSDWDELPAARIKNLQNNNAVDLM